jgi:hypothetical protein
MRIVIFLMVQKEVLIVMKNKLDMRIVKEYLGVI